jgi:hypothetical protein
MGLGAISAAQAAQEALPWWVGWGPLLLQVPAACLASALLGALGGRVRGLSGRALALFPPPILGALALSTGPLSRLAPPALAALCALASLACSVASAKRVSIVRPSLPLAVVGPLAAVFLLAAAPVALGGAAAARRGIEGEGRALVGLAMTGGNSQSLDALAWLLLGRGERAGAHALLRAAAESSPAVGIHRAHLSWALSQAGRCDEGESELRAARKLGVGPAEAGHGGPGSDPDAALARCKAASGVASAAAARSSSSAPPVASAGQVASASASASAAPASSAPVAYLKGQLHMHSANSKDSKTPPEDAARWYGEHGFDFIVFTDHNRVTDIPSTAGVLTIPGAELSQNQARCDPPPDLRRMRCILHMNALFADPPEGDGVIDFKPSEGAPRLALFQREIDVAQRMHALTQLNHPNFHYAASAKLIVELARQGVSLIEIANEAIDSNNDGDNQHPSTEALWDAALSGGAALWGVATDDAHHYYDGDTAQNRGEVAHRGNRGWVMVRAEKTREAIRAAIERGDFYSSTGVALRRIEVLSGALEVELAGDGSGEEVEFIGQGGKPLGKQRGPLARQPLPREGYVRAVVRGPRGKKAWTQPFRAAP